MCVCGGEGVKHKKPIFLEKMRLSSGERGEPDEYFKCKCFSYAVVQGALESLNML